MTESTYTTPDWFWEAIDTKPESGFVDVEGSDINYLYWSEAGNPGLLFVHGHNAHAHWWDFIAPSYKDDYYTVALDLSGMGDSDHRDEYSAEMYAKEIIAVADHCNMGPETILVSHSFGGVMSIKAVAQNPDRFKGLILLDSGVKHPDDVKPPEPERLARAKLYPTSEIAQSRFRLQPPQQCVNQYIVDHIARNSVEYIDEGFGWKFDEEQRTRMKAYADLEDDFKAITTKCALIYGAYSESFSARSAGYMKELLPHLEVTELADAQHHLFLDQPLTFMETLSAQLDTWK
ncbi:MAG: alpha/beta hydrolase [Pseudomonadales bacterium]|nr:alpha/beta hydrolase [Pseudomonadales bacterium]